MDKILNPVGDSDRTERLSAKTSFHKANFKANNQTLLLSEYGYMPDGKRVPDAYLVRISSIRSLATVVAPMQEDIMLRVESRWAPFIPTSILSAANAGVQVVTAGHKSLITKASTRRIWQGSSPMVLSLKLKFEAVSDPIREVMEPVRILGSIALPAENNTVSNNASFQAFVNKLPFLGPPGPSPFKITGLLETNKGTKQNDIATALDSLQGGDRIMIEFGQCLTFYNVIVREVSPAIPLKFDPDGNFISAVVNVVFETYEMMTAESFSEAFNFTEGTTPNNG